MKLIDTSSWLHQMRPSGDAAVRSRVESLLVSGRAAWCPMVRLELWRGVSSDRERKFLREYEAVITDLPITDQVWSAACDLGDKARRKGITCGGPDLLIAACAQHHGVEIETADSDFEKIMRL